MSCTTGSVVDSTANNPAPDVGQPTEEQPEEAVSQMRAADGAIPLGKIAVVAATNWTDPVGSIASLDTSANYAATLALTTTDGSDVVLRSFNGRVYVINRFGTDTIQVMDAKSYSVVADYSVGGGSNPQDIWVISDEKAYVTRHDSQNDKEIADDLLIINPLTGAQIGSLDFKSYMEDDGDKLSRAAQMVAVDKKLFVCLQDLQSNLMDPANTNGKVAVIDTETDEIITVIELSGRNPADITYSPLTKLIYVTDSGVFNNFVTDVTDGYGGIEVVDPETLESKGIVVDDAALGAYPSEIRLASDTLGFVIVGGMSIASFNPTSFEVKNNALYTISGFYLPDFSIDDNGNLLVTETSATTPGIVVVNPSDGTVVAGPIAVGAPPSSITFVNPPPL
jgi:hypothetical protein